MKIIIVGAGPIGCYTAQLLKKIGHKPILLEEHTSVGKPVQCAGIVSAKLISMIKTYISNEAMINQVNGFSIHSSWVENFFIKIPGVALVIDREKFDLSLGKSLDIRLGQKVCSIEKENHHYSLQTKEGNSYKADVLIGADGPDSIVRQFVLQNYKNHGNYLNQKIEYYFGMQYQIALQEGDELHSDDLIQVFFNGDIPFFIWIIPESEKRIRIGVVGNQGKKILDSFINNGNIKGKIIDIISGKIPMGFIQTCFENIALVGDAACQIKPLTGGGLSYGLQSAQILVDCIKNGELPRYDLLWKKRFGREIQFGLKARKIYEKLNDEERKKVFQLFKKNAHFIEQVIDFDHHSRLFIEAFKNPQLLIDAGKLLRYYWEYVLK